MPTSWVRTLFAEAPPTYRTAEDMHISFMMRKYLGRKTYMFMDGHSDFIGSSQAAEKIGNSNRSWVDTTGQLASATVCLLCTDCCGKAILTSAVFCALITLCPSCSSRLQSLPPSSPLCLTLPHPAALCLTLLQSAALCLTLSLIPSQPHTHTLTHSHTLLITCTCCYDQIKGTQDKDFSYSFSLILSDSL